MLQQLAPVLRPAEVAELMGDHPSIRLLDVRTPAEYETAHISGAYNVPLDTLGEHAREIRGVTDSIVLVCQSGQRARKAEEALKAGGMSNLHVMDGGVNAWIAANLPVVRGAKKLSLERQVRIVAGALAATGGLLAVFVNPLLGLLSTFVGGGLMFAGITDRCGMALVLGRLPYNRAASCDVSAMVRALSVGSAPVRATAKSIAAPTCCS